jgi:hypothetical protein
MRPMKLGLRPLQRENEASPSSGVIMVPGTYGDLRKNTSVDSQKDSRRARNARREDAIELNQYGI